MNEALLFAAMGVCLATALTWAGIEHKDQYYTRLLADNAAKERDALAKKLRTQTEQAKFWEQRCHILTESCTKLREENARLIGTINRAMMREADYFDRT